jgi:hypothetical protein
LSGEDSIKLPMSLHIKHSTVTMNQWNNDQPTGKQRTNQPKALPMDMVALNQELTTILKEASATAVRNVGRAATLFADLVTISAMMLPNPAITEAVKTQLQSAPSHNRMRYSDNEPMIEIVNPPDWSLPVKEMKA